MRTCVGVGALLAGGCDLVQPVDATAAVPEIAESDVEAPAAPRGLASKVATVVESTRVTESAPLEPPPEIGTPEPAPEPESEDITEFVPFAGAAASPAPKVPRRTKRPRRPRTSALAIAPDEPCETTPFATAPVATKPGWTDPCPACGRG